MYEPLICLVLSGCATPGTSGYRYEPPSQPPFENERIIEAPFSDVWDKMVGQLAKSFFVINNVEKASRIINVSFSSDAPEKYLDCGMSHRTFEEGDTATEYDYATAEASTYLVAGKWGNFDNLPSTASLRRTTTVEGRANIYVAPKED